MPAAAHTSVLCNSEAMYSAFKKRHNKSNAVPFALAGSFTLTTPAYAIAATDLVTVGDTVNFVRFPKNTWLLGYDLVITDLETATEAGASTAALNVATDTLHATAKVEIKSAFALSGESNGGSDAVFPIDVSNKYLGIKLAVVKAATNAMQAGTATLKLHLWNGEAITTL